MPQRRYFNNLRNPANTKQRLSLVCVSQPWLDLSQVGLFHSRHSDLSQWEKPGGVSNDYNLLKGGPAFVKHQYTCAFPGAPSQNVCCEKSPSSSLPVLKTLPHVNARLKEKITAGSSFKPVQSQSIFKWTNSDFELCRCLIYSLFLFRVWQAAI